VAETVEIAVDREFLAFQRQRACTNTFVVMALGISITGYSEVHEPERHIEFVIQIRSQGWTQSIQRRYSNFCSLHKDLKLRFRLSPRLPLPPLPGKKVWKRLLGGLDKADLESRRVLLQDYLSALQVHPTALESQSFAHFLDLPEAVRHHWIHHHITTSLSSNPCPDSPTS